MGVVEEERESRRRRGEKMASLRAETRLEDVDASPRRCCLGEREEIETYARDTTREDELARRRGREAVNVCVM